ncbi:hypothetical protein GQ472_05640 [archaeon]|nr:hypothetical protein [archaeon]
MSSDNDTFPGNDDIYLQIKEKLEQNKDINLQTTKSVSPLFINPENTSVKSIAAFIVYPKEPIYDVEALNSFAEDKLVPLFRSFSYEEAEIKNKYFLKIPIPGQSFITVPCLKRKDEYPAISSIDAPGHEIYYHIILYPYKLTTSVSSLPSCQICEAYSLDMKYIKAAKKAAAQQVLA